MPITTDPNDPKLNETRLDGQNLAYLVLSDEERAKGFLRPVRRSYKHVGLQTKNPMRDLTQREHELYDSEGYVKFEVYPAGSNAIGKFWTQADLDNHGCGIVTTMGQAIAETYARSPHFYGATFCAGCQQHLPVAEFVWIDDGTVLGS